MFFYSQYLKRALNGPDRQSIPIRDYKQVQFVRKLKGTFLECDTEENTTMQDECGIWRQLHSTTHTQTIVQQTSKHKFVFSSLDLPFSATSYFH